MNILIFFNNFSARCVSSLVVVAVARPLQPAIQRPPKNLLLLGRETRGSFAGAALVAVRHHTRTPLMRRLTATLYKPTAYHLYAKLHEQNYTNKTVVNQVYSISRYNRAVEMSKQIAKEKMLAAEPN